MSYLFSIKIAFLVFPLLAFLFTIPYILFEYHKRGAIHFFRTLIVYSFILYLLVIYFLVILPLPTFKEVMNNTGPYINLLPFKFIRDFVNETSLVISNPHTYLQALKEPYVYVVIFNIFMTIPFGMYLRYYFKCSVKKTIFFSFCLSLFFEITQVTGLYFIYPKPYRLFDVDDLLLNTLGGLLGYFSFGLISRFLPSKELIDEQTNKLAQTVSGLRRLTVFFLDLFIYALIVFFTSFIKIKFLYIYVFIIYYCILPVIIPGATLGMSFLNVKMHYDKLKVLLNCLRQFFLVLYYLVIPIFIGSTIYNLTSNLNIKVRLYMIIGYLIFYLVFYLVHILIILFKKRIYYDKLFGFRYESNYLFINNINKKANFND